MISTIKEKEGIKKGTYITFESGMDDQGMFYQVIINNNDHFHKLLYEGSNFFEASTCYTENEHLIN